MFLRIAVLVVLSLMLVAPSFAGERPECYQFYYRTEGLSEAKLQRIQLTCPVRPLAELYGNRAAHQAFLKKYMEPTAKDYPSSPDFPRYLEGYRINIALLELFASHYQGNLMTLIGEMNQGYREAMELARLRLGGVGWRVEWLNWIRSRQNSRRDRLGAPGGTSP